MLVIAMVFLQCTKKENIVSIPIAYAGGDSGLGHMLKIEGIVSGVKTVLIFDTGIGINLISKELCLELGCSIDGTTKGKRMTGQEVSVPMSTVESFEIAELKALNVKTGVLDFESFLPKDPEFENIGGYLSLNFFAEHPFTIDYTSKKMIFETKEGLAHRFSNGVVVPVVKKVENGALTLQVLVQTALEEPLRMQLDLGTDILTLNNAHEKEFEKWIVGKKVQSEVIEDETGFERKRKFVQLTGNISLLAEHSPQQLNPTVMFQDIIYDGVIGNDFFKERVVTYDLANSRIIIATVQDVGEQDHRSK